MKKHIALLLASFLFASPCFAESQICTEEVSSLSIEVAQLQAQISTLSEALNSLTHLEIDGHATDVTLKDEVKSNSAAAQTANERLDRAFREIKKLRKAVKNL